MKSGAAATTGTVRTPYTRPPAVSGNAHSLGEERRDGNPLRQCGVNDDACASIDEGGGFGWDPPPPRVPLWSPPKAGQKFQIFLNPVGTKGAETKIWPSASNIGRGEGYRGGYPPLPLKLGTSYSSVMRCCS